MVDRLHAQSITSEATPTKATQQHVAQQTLTLPAVDGMGGGVSVWSRLLLWLPYALFTFFLLALVAASFFTFHRKHGHKYRRRRSDVWRDLDMQTLGDHAPHLQQHQQQQQQSASPKSFSQSNGEPERQSLLAKTDSQLKRQRKESIKYAPNGNLTDVRGDSDAPPKDSSAPPTAFLQRSVSLRQTTGNTSTPSDVSSRSRPVDVMTSLCESPHSQTIEYEGGRGLEKRQSLRVERGHRTLMRSKTDSDDIIRVVLRGNDSEITSKSSSARPARVSLPAREPGYSDDQVTTTATRQASVKSQRTLPSQPGLVHQSSSRGRQLPQPPAARV